MGSGKRKMLDCGHEGEAVVGQFYLCPICDADDITLDEDLDGIPMFVDPEATKKLCPHCGSDDIDVYPGFTTHGKDLYHCHHCMRSHTR